MFNAISSKAARGSWLMFTAALSAISGAAQAQTQAQPNSEPVEEIVVTAPIASAQAASISQKRAADNLVEIAAADAVGRFPDQNTAAALARLPAVAVQRDQGQERYVQVRGAPNRWISVSFDGVPLIGVDEGGTTRAFRFDAVPAVLLSAAAINKSLTPDLSSEAVVANIDLRTYSPLSKEGFSLQGDAGLGQMELGEGEQRQGSLRGSWSNDRFGVVLGASHYRREQVTDNREVGAYNGRVPTELDIRNYQLIRENNGAFAGVEFMASPDLILSAKAIFTEFTDIEDRDQYEFRLDRAPGFATSGRGGDLVNVPVRASFNEGEYLTRYDIYTLGADYDANGWDVKARLNYTESENTTYLPLTQMSTSSSQNVSLNYNFDDPNFPIISLFRTVPGTPPTRGAPLAALDQTAFASVIFIPALQDSFSESVTAKIDFSREFTDDLTLSGGFSYTDRQLDGFTFAFSNVANLTGRIIPANYVTSTPWSTGFPLGISFNLIDNQRLRRDAEAALVGAPTTTPGVLFDPARNIPDINRYNLSEVLFTGYGAAEWRFDGGQVIAGLRFESFEGGNAGTVQTGANAFQRISLSNEYTDLFPSLNVRLDLRDDVVLRLAGQRSLARPSFGEVRVGASINDTATPGTISGGNPDLQPEYTWGADASLEYYPTRNSILAVSVYKRWVENVLFSNTQTVGSDVFNSNGVNRAGYLLTSTFNGDEGELMGLELNYQQQFAFLPGALNGLGFQGNLTFLEGEFDTAQRKGIGFPGASDTIVNASVYYEKFGFSGRVSYQWRSDWLDTLGGFGIGSSGDEFRKAYENLDVALRYAINERISLFADLNNLTDEKYIAFQGDEGRPTEVEQIGSRYMFGLRFGL